MRHVRRSIWVFLFLAIACYQPAWAKIYLDIDSPTFRPFVIAIPDFQSSSGEIGQPAGAGEPNSRDLTAYLKMTGFFNFIDKKAFLEPSRPRGNNSPGAIQFSDWKALGAEYLVKGNAYPGRNGLVLECRLYDVMKGELVAGKKYEGPTSGRKTMIRKFAGEMLSVLTGEGGIFGSRIAFVTKDGNTSSILSVNFDGSNLVTEKETDSILMSPRWSPDGRYLSYTSFEAGHPDFYIKDLRTSNIEKWANYKGINLSGGWSPDSKKILLTLTKDNNEEIYLFDHAGKEPRRLTRNFVIDVSPSWSPDGSQIVFVSNRSGSPQIYIMDAGGNNVKRLTFNGNYNASPAWSPKGDRIAYAGMTGGLFQIFTINVDGSEVKQLTSTTGGNGSEYPAWSPDGRYIAFSKSEGGKQNIYVMNAAGTNVRLLYEGSGENRFPSWSAYSQPD